MFVLGIAWAFGKASVFKYISDDYPANIGVISGVVGLAGGMGGFVLPIMFGALMDLTGIRSSAFMLMYGVVWVSLIWMYWTEVRGAELMGSNAEAVPPCGPADHSQTRNIMNTTNSRRCAVGRAHGGQPCRHRRLAPRGQRILGEHRQEDRLPQPVDLGARVAVRLRRLGHVGNHHRADAQPGFPVHPGASCSR